MVKTYGHIINGKEIKSDSKKTFQSINPTTEQPIAKFQQGTLKDLNNAISSAQKAQKKWSSIPAPHRGDTLLEISKLLKKHKQRLGKLVSTEMGKIIQEGLGDVQEAIDIFEYMAGEGRRLHGHTTPSELQNKICYTQRDPIGIVGMITPWNFPIAIPSWKLAPSLICGNATIFKPSSNTPLCAYELVKICEQAGVPKGVINLITGSGEQMGTPMIKHPKIKAISFTGSKATGEFITSNAGLKKIGLELGGKNPIIIMDDADIEPSLKSTLFGAFGTTGQRCTATSRILIHKKIFKEFQEKLLKATKKNKTRKPAKIFNKHGALIWQKRVR